MSSKGATKHAVTAESNSSCAFLEVPDSQQGRLHVLKGVGDLLRSSSGNSSNSVTAAKPNIGPLPVIGERSVLSRVKGFLPVMLEANRTLDQSIRSGQCPADSCNIECVDPAAPHIEMDLALVQHSDSEVDEDSDSDSSSSSLSSSPIKFPSVEPSRLRDGLEPKPVTSPLIVDLGGTSNEAEVEVAVPLNRKGRSNRR